MFWNKKDKTELEAYHNENERRYGLYALLTTRVNRQEEKLDLILSHLKLKYIPETETKEPAKLVEKTVAHPFFDNLENGAIVRLPDGFGGTFTAITPTPPKKKGRPKKK